MAVRQRAQVKRLFAQVAVCPGIPHLHVGAELVVQLFIRPIVDGLEKLQ